jgi:effector-binding domain-containing protein
MRSFWNVIKSLRREIAFKGRPAIIALSALIAIELVIIAGLCIDHIKAESNMDVSLREVAPQTVLYTVHRGHYSSVGPVINRLNQLAIAKGLHPCGSPSIGCLNNPGSVSSGHWLIEIQIPVEEEAMVLAGTLGKMTDVKRLPAMSVAVAAKGLGLADPEPVIHRLYAWINQHGYVIAGRLR